MYAQRNNFWRVCSVTATRSPFRERKLPMLSYKVGKILGSHNDWNENVF
jgi:hypothetical protein